VNDPMDDEEIAREASRCRSSVLAHLDVPAHGQRMALELMALRRGEMTAEHVENAESIRHRLITGLVDSDLFAVTDEVSDLLNGAAGGYPDANIHLSDILTPHGMAVFSKPITDPGAGLDVGPLRAISWTVMRADDPVAQLVADSDEGFFVMIVAYVDTAGITALLSKPLHNYPRIYPVVSVIWETDSDGSGIEWHTPAGTPYIKTLLAFWAIMRQRLTASKDPVIAVSPKHLTRAKRRHPDLNTRLQVVRMKQRKPRKYTGDHGFNRMETDHRYAVRPYWRYEFYPSTGQRKPNLVLSHFRGPWDAPVRNVERVFLPPKPLKPPPGAP